MQRETGPLASPNSPAPMQRDLPVASLMRRRWIATPPSASVADVALLMRVARVRQLPVQHEGLLVGLVDHHELLTWILARIRSEEPGAWRGLDAIRDATMDSQPPRARPEEALGTAALRMIGAGIACLPVVEETGRMVGLLVESDLLRSFYREGGGSVS
jgi:CBS domain-containing protein